MARGTNGQIEGDDFDGSRKRTDPQVIVTGRELSADMILPSCFVTAMRPTVPATAISRQRRGCSAEVGWRMNAHG